MKFLILKIPDTQIFVDFKNWSESYDTDLKKTLEKISLKAERCSCKLAVIANIIADKKYKIRQYEKKGIRILVVPSLLQYVDSEITINEKAINEIRRCLDDYAD